MLIKSIQNAILIASKCESEVEVVNCKHGVKFYIKDGCLDYKTELFNMDLSWDGIKLKMELLKKIDVNFINSIIKKAEKADNYKFDKKLQVGILNVRKILGL